jgi:hypothetical protein
MTRRGRLEYAPPASHAWTVIAHAHVVSILPATTPPELIARLWSAATTASVSLESYVAAIPLFGRDAVESFAVALIEDVRQGTDRPEARIEVVLRGDGIARLDTASGTRTIDARSSQPWYLGEFDDVTSFVLAAKPVADSEVADDAATLPLLSGVVPAGWVRWTPKTPVPAETGELDDTVLGLGTGRREAPAAVPVDADPAVPAVGGLQADDDDPISGDTVLGSRTASSAPYPGSVGDDDPITGDTVLGSREASPAPYLDPADPVEGATVIPARNHGVRGPYPAPAFAADLADTVLGTARPPASRPSPAVAGGLENGGERPFRNPLYAFRVGRGDAYPLERPAYLGRKPSAPRIVTGPSPRLVSVGSPRQEVSSTHLEIRQEGTTVVVTDLRSTNGTIVSAPGADRLMLRQGQSVVVAPGTRIDIGDGNVVEILPAR